MTRPKSTKKDSKAAILETAITLFARKGYAATGVREIARVAGVNQAMVNYYYGSKIKLLETIFGLAIDSYAGVAVKTLSPQRGVSLEAALRAFFRAAIAVVREHRDVFRITWSEMHHDNDEIAAFKGALVKNTIFPVLSAFAEHHRQAIAPGLRIELIGPTLPGMVAWHFMIAPIISHVLDTELDDAFYDDYAKQLARFALHGLAARPEEGR